MQSIVKVPVAPELQEEIRAIMGQLDLDHVDFPHMILVLVRAGLRIKKQEVESFHRAIDECALEDLQRQQVVSASAPAPLDPSSRCRIIELAGWKQRHDR